MAELSSRDLNDIIAVSHSALDCSDLNELRQRVLNVIEPVFKTDRGNFFLARTANRLDLDTVQSRGIGRTTSIASVITITGGTPFFAPSCALS